MKKSILILAVLLASTTFTFAQWGNNSIKGNGNMKTETRTTSNYDGVKCAGSFDYVLVKGTEGKIILEGEENLLEYIVVEVKNNNLIIKTEDRVNLRTSNNKTITITIPFEEIDEVALAGSGDLHNEDVINSNDFVAELAGSGDMVLKVNASEVKASIAGSGDLTLTGETNNLEAKVAGSGNFHGFDFNANNVEVSVAGSGDADVVCNGELKARVAGSGDITYKGNPKKEDTKVSGSGDVSSRN
ncbi:Putative auto-transporter adhesin, head GIN domain [Flavobacteriaceae bacterium MAR_2010_188]|nr:Putative auto-transporter adhesin, head GIN domain [Flavobacteriaceae bacterium MAR_2010_188]